MNRKLGVFLAAVLVAAGIYWAIERGPLSKTPSKPRHGAPPPQAVPSPPAESRPESLPVPIATTPFVEAEPESRPESAPASAPVREVVVIEVVREDGRAIPGAIIGITFDSSREFETDAEGRTELPAFAKTATQAVVSGLNFCAVRKEITLDSGVQRIVVPDRSRVAGRVTVSGRIPDEPVQIRIDGQHESCVVDPHRTSTAEDGSFEFFNLPPTWSGEIGVPCDYAFVDKIGASRTEDDPCATGRQQLDGPNPTLELRLGEYPAIKGRIVLGSIRAKVGYAMARATFRYADGSMTSTVRPGSDGRFRIPVPTEAQAATATLSDGFGLGSRAIELQGPFDGVRDLGNIELASIRQIHLHVRDSSGHPVVGAVAAISETSSRSTPTDEEGKASISADLGRSELRVAKVGYTTTVIPLPEDVTEPLEIELRPGNQLIIETRLGDGDVPWQGLFSVHLTAKGTLFAGRSNMADDLLGQTGATESYEEGTSHEESYISFRPDDLGRVIAAGFRPGAEVTVQLRARTLDELLAERFVVVDAAGTTKVTLQAQGMPQHFAGVVRTEGGDPIDGADVSISVKESRESNGETSSGAEGRFELDGVFALSVDVSIEKEGFVPLRQKDVPVPPPGAQRDFILVPSRDVTIVLVDEKGKLVLGAADVSVVVPGDVDYVRRDTQPESEDGGSYFIWGLRPGPIQIHVTIGETYVVSPHDSRRPIARVVIPSDGTVEILWRRNSGDPSRCRIRVEAQGGGIVFHRDLSADTEHRIESKLAPGLYSAAIEGLDEDGTWTDLAFPATFEIAAHQRTAFEIER